MTALLSSIQDAGFIVLTFLAELVLVVAGILVITYIKKGLSYLNIKNDNQLYTEIEKVVLNIVGYMNQRVVDAWKKESDDGSLTKDQQSMVFNQVKAKVSALLTTEQIKYLTKQYTNLDTGLDYIIENCVRTCDNKSEHNNISDAILEGTLLGSMINEQEETVASIIKKTESIIKDNEYESKVSSITEDSIPNVVNEASEKEDSISNIE